MEKNWIYLTENENTVRYVLGYIKNNPLFVIGINPSTAEPDKLDPTLKSVERIAFANGYDSFVMLNVYPERCTNFSKLSDTPDDDYIVKNAITIETVLGLVDDATIWLAFGDMIEKRDYLKYSFLEILGRTYMNYKDNFVCAGLTKKGNPRHPLYLRSDTKLEPYNIEEYISIS